MKYSEKRIENFTIIQNRVELIVNYKKAAKDWFDAFIVIVIGLCLFVATYFLISQGIKTMNYITIGGGLIFAFQAFLQSFSGISRIFESSKNIIIINRSTNTLTSKKNLFTSKTFSLENIEAIVINGKKEKLFARNSMIRTYCTITARLKDKTEERLFTINTKRFFQIDSEKMERELYTQATQLTKELNKFLKLKYEWNGYNEE